MSATGSVSEFAVQVPAVCRSNGCESVGVLPVWVDTEGRLRIAVGKLNPRHTSEAAEIIVEPGLLLRGVGMALGDADGNDVAVRAGSARSTDQPRDVAAD